MKHKSDYILVHSLVNEIGEQSDIYINTKQIAYVEVRLNGNFDIVLMNDCGIEVDAIDARKVLLMDTLKEEDIYNLVPEETIQKLLNNPK